MNQPSYAKWIAFNLAACSLFLLAWYYSYHIFAQLAWLFLAVTFLVNAIWYTNKERKERKLWQRWQREEDDRHDWIIKHGLNKP